MSNGPEFITFDLSGLLAVPQSTRIIYQTAWNDFERIQAYNWGVSTARAQGDREQVYYIYYSNDELNSFTVGRFLHVQRYPGSNWLPVPKN
jgi:hypothetical protein